MKAELQRVLTSELATRKFSYPRSDGSAWTLTLRDVIDRAVDLEVAYNPNDCVELRWGAPAKSDEASTCKRYAPAAQREKMSKYRAWFHERRVGGLLHAVARLAAVDCNRRSVRLSRSGRTAARALRDAEGQERRGGEGRIAARARVRAGDA